MNRAVLLGCTPPPAGGIATWTMGLMNSKPVNGWEYVLVDEKIIGKREVFGSKSKMNVTDEIRRCFSIWGRLRKAVKDDSVKVVHANFAAGSLPMLRECICGLIARRYGKKFVIHLHCTVPNVVKGGSRLRVLKMITSLSNAVICLNKESEEYLKNLTAKPVYCIPNYIAESEISESHRINDTVKTAVYVGGVIENKGCLDILKVAETFPEISFRMIGRPDGKTEAAAGKISNVILTGQKEHSLVREELKNADVFLFLSYFEGEGFSVSLLEAMAEGLPCIVTDWAGNKDMIGDAGGITVSVKAPQEAIAALKAIMPPEVRQTQSDRNIREVKEKYTDRIILKRYADVYNSLIRD